MGRQTRTQLTDAAKQQMRPKGADGFSYSDLSAEVCIHKSHPSPARAHNRDCPPAFTPTLAPCAPPVAWALVPLRHICKTIYKAVIARPKIATEQVLSQGQGNLPPHKTTASGGSFGEGAGMK
jgi:hypothetical protein